MVGLLVVLSYYLWPSAEGFFRTISKWKVEGGYLFAALSTAFFAGALPFLFQKLQKGKRAPMLWSHFGFSVVFWAARGVEIDALYRLQAFVFGDTATWGAVIPKVLIDQFVYGPAWAVPTTVILYLWKDCGFRIGRTRTTLGERWYYRRAVPVMIANWAVWIPAVTLIYFLPQPLQLPLQNIVACFWVLLLLFITGSNLRTPEQTLGKPAGFPEGPANS